MCRAVHCCYLIMHSCNLECFQNFVFSQLILEGLISTVIIPAQIATEGNTEWRIISALFGCISVAIHPAFQGLEVP